MKELPDLKNLSPEEKDALIIGLCEELLKLRKQVEELQAKQKQSKKTSKNSGLPPAKGFKPNVETSGLKQSGAGVAIAAWMELIRLPGLLNRQLPLACVLFILEI